jgi:hypothetical protein
MDSKEVDKKVFTIEEFVPWLKANYIVREPGDNETAYREYMSRFQKSAKDIIAELMNKDDEKDDGIVDILISADRIINDEVQ